MLYDKLEILTINQKLNPKFTNKLFSSIDNRVAFLRVEIQLIQQIVKRAGEKSEADSLNRKKELYEKELERLTELKDFYNAIEFE